LADISETLKASLPQRLV